VEGSASGANPKVNVSYEPNQDLTLYAQIAKGFRPGGVNLPDAVPPCATPVPASYGPDSIWNYEIGEKARFADGKLTVNADVFYIRWNALQQNLTLPCSYPFTANVGTAESYGPELEINAQVSRDFGVSLSGSYTQAHVTSVDSALLGNTIGSVEPLVPGIPVLNVPKYDVTAAINFAHPISDNYKLTARVSATTTGPFYDIDYYVQELPGYTTADARFGVVGGPWAVYLFARNLTDKIAILTINTHSWSEPTPALNTPSVTTPRTIGLEVNYKY
jgi:outer membrane receptor protein involved in Fe transport